jgi:valyl-tRNA synthetase
MILSPMLHQRFADPFDSSVAVLIYELWQPLGSESLVERWTYHKLDVATTDVNKALYERNFMAATNAVYNFWLYELCDVYIVSATTLRL